MNTILLTDSYKISHWMQYPPGTTNVYSYFESRGSKWDFGSTIFFGLQYIMDTILSKPITQADINEAGALCAQHFGTPELFNRAGWDRILYYHGGRLPVRIKAVPEGMCVPTHNVLMTIENTDPAVPWLTNFLETVLAQVWYPTTVATLSFETKKLIYAFLNATGDTSLIDFKLHDFGFRGASSVESAGLGGAAHLVNFKGTDTIPALVVARDHYAEPMAGFSVPASEHSTMTSWGRDHEVDAYRNMIEQYGDQPFYSVVSDSYDLLNAARDMWGGTLRADVEAAPGTLVVRPDSGYPPVIVSTLLSVLADRFGATENSKGFKVLNPKVRVIQGDGMDYRLIDQTLETMMHNGWSADNVTFGMGGGLLQKIDRDTMKFAFKCSSATVNGEERDVFKNPATDQGKVSKKGRLALVLNGHGLVTDRLEGHENDDLLETVFENGKIVKRHALSEIRERADIRPVVHA